MTRTVRFPNWLVRRLHGGLARVPIVADMMLAAVSDAAVVWASALGSTPDPAMRICRAHPVPGLPRYRDVAAPRTRILIA
ncbi:hypothetical protein [Marinovum sp.]|uniref:hypothetical protein n=1 Tax=Marinovum sp. TaxID=2024839 RepID=UPI003A5C8349